MDGPTAAAGGLLPVGGSQVTRYLDQLTQAIERHRLDDPTTPVKVVLSTRQEADELRTALARSPEPLLHIGVTACTAADSADGPARLAAPHEIADAVRRAAQTGYFSPLDGLTGVTNALTAAVGLWDLAGPRRRSDVGSRGRTDADRRRLAAVGDLHERVGRNLARSSAVLPSSVLGQTLSSPPDVLWIDSTVTVLAPAEDDWLARLRTTATVVRVDPAEGAGAGCGLATLISAVDPVDEAHLAARSVAAALEHATAARDVIVAVTPTHFDRYADLVGDALTGAGIPNDRDPSGPHARWDTRAGRTVAAVIDAVADIGRPGDLRFDHLRHLAEAGGLVDHDGAPIARSRLRRLWECVRGSDSAKWADALVGDPEPEAARALTAAAHGLQVLAAAHEQAAPWADLAAATRALLGRLPSRSEADGTVLASLQDTISAWEHRADVVLWPEARDELVRALSGPLGETSGGVRIVALDAAWALAPRSAVVVGLSDDMLPGVQAAVGPLTAEEALWLRTPSGRRQEVAQDGLRSLKALLAASGAAVGSYSRSDQLRTIVRQPSRHLNPLGVVASVARYEAVAAQFRALDNGHLGLLGPGDAAASLLRCGAATQELEDILGRDHNAAIDCLRSRHRPPPPAAVDPFNGDLTELAREQAGPLSPDFRHDGPPGASPSATEMLLDCPVGWWAARRIRADDPQDWDPIDMDARAYGSWLHEAFRLLSDENVLLASDLPLAAVERALWDALGGPPGQPSIGNADLGGFRHRVTDNDVRRAARSITSVAGRLRTLLDEHGGSRSATAEQTLGPATLPLPSGPLALSGRTDRIDEMSDGSAVVTDFKTGRTGSGFQLAVYAWLRLQLGGGPARLLYAVTGHSAYRLVSLVDDGPTTFAEQSLAAYLTQRLAQPVDQARAGIFPSRAWADDHDPYCPVCGDLVPAAGVYHTTPRSDRALALRPTPAASNDKDGS